MKGNSSNLQFKPSAQGFIDFRNEGFIQNVCLRRAQDVASIAGGSCGKAFRCDVQPGKTRCHARATCDVPIGPKDEFGVFWEVAASGGAAAEACGGKSTYKKGVKR